jgi:hypothetical protein
MGSDVTSTYVVTDENTGEIYLLQGNDSLLKQNVGHEVIVTGAAYPVRPSDKKGSIGYISPSEPNRTGDTSANAGQKALNFDITHIQPVANNCSQQSESQKAAIAASQAALGSVKSNNPNAIEPKVGYHAQAPQQTPGQQNPSAQDYGRPVAVTGKTGNEGEEFPATTTSSVGQVTPGEETQAGKAQAAGRQTGIGEGGIRQPQAPTAAQGAPPAPEQAAQNPAAAERIASSAQRAEVNNSQHQLGVNAQPNYDQSAQQQTSQANQPVSGYEQNRNPQNQTSLPGASQHIGGGQGHWQQEAEKNQNGQPTLVGCLTSSGPSSHEFYLTEQKSGTRYRLDATREELKDHVNHLVELVGKPGNREKTSKAVASRNEPVFQVSGVQDLAPTCGAAR